MKTNIVYILNCVFLSFCGCCYFFYFFPFRSIAPAYVEVLRIRSFQLFSHYIISLWKCSESAHYIYKWKTHSCGHGYFSEINCSKMLMCYVHLYIQHTYRKSIKWNKAIECELVTFYFNLPYENWNKTKNNC